MGRFRAGWYDIWSGDHRVVSRAICPTIGDLARIFDSLPPGEYDVARLIDDSVDSVESWEAVAVICRDTTGRLRIGSQ